MEITHYTLFKPTRANTSGYAYHQDFQLAQHHQQHSTSPPCIIPPHAAIESDIFLAFLATKQYSFAARVLKPVSC
eukprot:6459899-Amphidinium_carterae.2